MEQRRSSTFHALWGGVVLMAVGVAVVAHHQPGWLDWQVFALTLAGFGTLTLATATFDLVTETKQGRADTHRLAKLAERDQEARVRPAVMLWHDTAWFAAGSVGARSQRLPFQNAGGGPAVNVEVQVYWYAGNCALATTSIGPGERTWLFARTLIGSFEEAWGLATYSDLLGRRWETRFAIETGPDGQPQFQLCAYGLADLLPRQAHPAGWDYGSDGLPRICLPPETS